MTEEKPQYEATQCRVCGRACISVNKGPWYQNLGELFGLAYGLCIIAPPGPGDTAQCKWSKPSEETKAELVRKFEAWDGVLGNGQVIEEKRPTDMDNVIFRLGQVWQRDGLKREIVRIVLPRGRLGDQEVKSALVCDGIYEPFDIVWRRPKRKGGKEITCWCSTWMTWVRKAKLVEVVREYAQGKKL